MTALQDIPISKLVLPYAIGLLLPETNAPLWIVVCVLTAISAFLHLVRIPPNVLAVRLHAFILTAAAFSLGWYSVRGQGTLDRLPKAGVYCYWVELIDVHGQGGGRIQGYFRVRSSTQEGGKEHKVRGSIRCDKPELGKVGQEFVVRTRMVRIKDLRNPFGYDARAYHQAQGVHLEFWADEAQFVPLPSAANWYQQLRRAGPRMGQRFSECFSSRDAGILSALVLGDRTGLQNEIKASFIRSGTIHVLAVSGLHVGALFMGLGALGKLIHPRIRRYGWSAVVFLCIWAYAFLSGLGWPVVRACTMMTLMQLSVWRKGSHNAANALFVSAWIALTIEPLAITQLSFQYSYLALAGLIWVYPRFESKKHAPPVLKEIKDLAAVSLSAQLFLVPYAIQNFRQFPLHFLLGNLVVVPYMIALFYMGVVFLLLTFLGIPHDWLDGLMRGVLELACSLANSLAGWDVAMLEGLHWDIYDVLVAYAVIATILCLRRQRFRVLALILGVLWFSNPRKDMRYLILYRDWQCMALVLDEGEDAVLFASAADLAQERDGRLTQTLKARGYKHIRRHPFELLSRPDNSWGIKRIQGTVSGHGMCTIHILENHDPERPGGLQFAGSEGGWVVRGSRGDAVTEWALLKGNNGFVIER